MWSSRGPRETPGLPEDTFPHVKQRQEEQSSCIPDSACCGDVEERPTPPIMVKPPNLIDDWYLSAMSQAPTPNSAFPIPLTNKTPLCEKQSRCRHNRR